MNEVKVAILKINKLFNNSVKMLCHSFFYFLYSPFTSYTQNNFFCVEIETNLKKNNVQRSFKILFSAKMRSVY